MRNIGFFSLVFSSLLVGALSASPPLEAPPIDWSTDELPVAPSVGVNVDVILASGPTDGDVVGVWPDINTYAPYYSIYHNGAWTTGAIPLGASAGVYDNMYVTAGPTAGMLVAAWSDSFAEEPYFSVYNGTTWTPASAISLGASIGCYNDVTLAAGPSVGQVIGAWTNLGSHGPYYSIYSGGVWTTNAIAVGASTGAANNTFVASDLTGVITMATWTDYMNDVPYYSIYNLGTWVTGGIPLGTSASVALDVTLAAGPGDGELVAAWADGVTNAPYFSIYNGGSWSTGTISLGTSSGCLRNVYVAAGPAAGELIATWSDVATNAPFYAVYRDGVWGSALAFPLDTSVGAHNNVGIARTLNGYTMVAGWANVPYTNIPYYSFFVGETPAPLPPTHGQGKHVKDRFALVVEWYNELKWRASPSSDVIGYNIRRNGVLIIEGLPHTFYVDHDRPKKGLDVYVITSVFADGTESLTGLEIRI